MMYIIDGHAHIFPEKIAAKATAGISEFYDTEMDNQVASCDNLIKNGQQAGISKYLVHSVATTPKQVQSINNFLSEECKKRPEFIGFAALHPDFEDIEDEVERCIELGLKGVKLHPDIQKFLLDEDKALRIYRAIEGRLPLLIHMGDFRYQYSKPARLARVLDMFPRLDCIGAHFGGWSETEEAIKHLKSRRCWVDTSSTYGFIKNLDYMKHLISEFGADRVVFGTDFPMWRADYELEWLLKCGLSEEELELILHKNIENILASYEHGKRLV
ncbi:MAG: amidohydrolase [Oscillospiraceae bacterium]|jgi:predicted TIM-barrel fold metal-dependent hydrolase|nr:amidohydrolase [Oscillospiraceae bacterium]